MGRSPFLENLPEFECQAPFSFHAGSGPPPPLELSSLEAYTHCTRAQTAGSQSHQKGSPLSGRDTMCLSTKENKVQNVVFLEEEPMVLGGSIGQPRRGCRWDFGTGQPALPMQWPLCFLVGVLLGERNPRQVGEALEWGQMISFNSLLSRQPISAGWTGPPLVCPLLALLGGSVPVMFSHYP